MIEAQGISSIQNTSTKKKGRLAAPFL